MSDFHTIPVVRIEVERASHAIMACINQEMFKLDTDIRAAVEQALNPENVKRILRDAVQTTLKNAIEREVSEYYRYGDGQKRLKKAVADTLSAQHFKD